MSPRYPRMDILGVLRGQILKKYGKDGITARPIGTKLCAHNYADGSRKGQRLTKIRPVRYQGKHFNQGLSRGNIWGFSPLGGGVNISSKVWI